MQFYSFEISHFSPIIIPESVKKRLGVSGFLNNFEKLPDRSLQFLG
jgi:hypothetical protein